jgi:hypothetical protein
LNCAAHPNTGIVDSLGCIAAVHILKDIVWLVCAIAQVAFRQRTVRQCTSTAWTRRYSVNRDVRRRTPSSVTTDYDAVTKFLEISASLGLRCMNAAIGHKIFFIRPSTYVRSLNAAFKSTTDVATAKCYKTYIQGFPIVNVHGLQQLAKHPRAGT